MKGDVIEIVFQIEKNVLPNEWMDVTSFSSISHCSNSEYWPVK